MSDQEYEHPLLAYLRKKEQREKKARIKSWIALGAEWGAMTQEQRHECMDRRLHDIREGRR